MTAKPFEVYKCGVCGIVIEILDGGAGEPICCGLPMMLLTERTSDQGLEKHVPVVEKLAGGIRVKVGAVPHPMEEKHFIQWIEVIGDGGTQRQFLKPGQAPAADFQIKAPKFAVRELCNIHGLWKRSEAPKTRSDNGAARPPSGVFP